MEISSIFIAKSFYSLGLSLRITARQAQPSLFLLNSLASYRLLHDALHHVRA